MASTDNLFVVVSVFILAIGFLVMLGVWGSMTSVAMNADFWELSEESESIRDHGQTTYDNADMYFVIAFFGAHLAILVTAFALRSHPIIYVAGIFIIVILMLTAVPLSNTYNELEEGVLSEAGTSLPRTTFLMENLPKIELIFGFITLVVLAGLARTEGLV